MRIEKITRDGKVFAILPMDLLKKLMDDAEMLADVAAYDAAKARIESGEEELIPLELIKRRLAGESTVKSGASIADSPRTGEEVQGFPVDGRRDRGQAQKRRNRDAEKACRSANGRSGPTGLILTPPAAPSSDPRASRAARADSWPAVRLR